MTNETSGPKSSAASPPSDLDTQSSKMSLASAPSTEKKVPMTDAYAAGLTDGEGSLSMNRTFAPRVDIQMTSKALPILRALERTYGGKVRKSREATDRWAEAWNWTINSWSETTAFLRDVSPFLILKKEQARLILRAAEIRSECPGRYGGSRPDAVKWTAEAKRRVEAIRKRIQELNRRGPSEDLLREGAIALLVGGEWVTPQLDLFSDLGYTPFSGDWPRSGMSRDGVVYELPMSARLMAGTDGSVSPVLLPNPQASESTPTDEFLEEVRAHLDPDDPLHRLYLPGRKWMTQRTLSRTVPALLPTPGAHDGKGAEKETRDRRRESGATGGPSLRDLPKLLPTPTTQDGENTAGPSQRERNSEPLNVVAADAADGKLLPTPTAGDAKASGSRNLEGSKAHSGVSLTDAIQTGNSETPRLLPTPQAADGDGGRQEKGAMGRAGRRSSGQKATLPLGTAVSMRETISGTPFAEEGAEQPTLLPTPVANEENPGAGGELRAALTHGEGRRNESGTDTLGRPNRGKPSKLLPTPTAEGGERGRAGAGADRLGARTFDDPQLLPTPRVTSERTGRKAMVENQQWSAPGLAQAVELARGELPREFDSWDEVPGSLGQAARPTDDGTVEEGGVAWGVYGPAVRRWERILGRPAPAPTDEKGRLAPAFVEWMLGYPEGWVSAVDIPRTAQLRILGNSVQIACSEKVGEWLLRLTWNGIL